MLANLARFDWFVSVAAPKHDLISSVPVVSWQPMLEKELGVDANRLNVKFAELPQLLVPVDFINRFVPDRDEAVLTEAVLDCLHDYINAVRLPRSTKRLIFAITGCLNQLALIKRTKAGQFELRTIELHCWPDRSGRKRRHQMKAFGKRAGIGVLESVTSNVYNTETPSAAQCIVALLIEHLAAKENGCLCDAFGIRLDDVDALARLAPLQNADASAGVVALFHLRMNGMLDVDSSRQLIEEAESFAERATSETMAQELTALADMAHKYSVKIGESGLYANHVFDLLRNLIVYTFGLDEPAVRNAAFANMPYMPVYDAPPIKHI
jgi:hypothetical protein